MKKNIVQIIIIAAFFICFGYFFGDEYWEYQENHTEYVHYQEQVVKGGDDFLLENISSFSGDTELHTLPDRDFLDELVSEIDNAQEKVFVEVYIFTERDLRDALIRAHARGVKVKILLENNPYKAPYLNDAHYEVFIEAGLDVKWSDPLNYSLNHSKLLIIDERAYVSTGNFSYSLFTKNRDFMISVTDKDLVTKLVELFMLDYGEKIGGVIHPNIIISPSNSRISMTKLVEQAEESVDFYFPYIADDEFKNALFQVSKKQIQIRGIVAKTTYEEDRENIREFQEKNIQMSYLKTPKLHAKAILVDKKYLYIGSINFSTYSFDENREIGLLISDENIIAKFINIFESDF